jgi:MoxR-like ATPase
MRFSDATKVLTSILQYNVDQMQANMAKGVTRTSDYVVPFFYGDPGVGKTAIPRFVAEQHDLPYGQAIVAQYDAGEMAGIPFVRPIDQYDEDGELMEEKDYQLTRERPDYLPTFDAGIFNLDEMPQAFLANQNICSQLINEYRVGHHHISPAICICATGNKPENKAGTTTMPTHVRDRINSIEIEADQPEFLSYAAQKGLDRRVRAFIRENPALLHDFNVTALANPTPRSWEKTSTVLQLGLMNDNSLREGILTEMVIGQIGEGAGRTFISWLRVEDKMPKLEELLKDPKNTRVFGAEDASINYLLLSSLADIASPKNMDAIVEYISRIPNAEFMAMWAQETVTRDPTLTKTPALKKWMMTTGTDLML